MQTSTRQYDIIIQPSQQGLTFAVSVDRPLTFAQNQSKKTPWRWLVSAAISLMVLTLPNLSLAATYTGAELVTATNQVRVAHGLAALTANTALEQAATKKAQDMFAQNYFGHYSPTGTSPWVFFKSAGYTYTAAGENLAADYVDGADIVPAWMASKTHRDNLLNPLYHDIGIAVMDGTINGAPTTVVVQFFGSRKSTAVVAPASAKLTPVAIAKPATSKPAPAPTVVTPPVPVVTQTTTQALPAVQPAVTPTPVIEQAPVAEIKGVATEDIHTLNIPTTRSMEPDPRVGLLTIATLGLYAMVLAAAGLAKGLTSHPKQVLITEFDQLPA